jgi:hypothetical protein
LAFDLGTINIPDKNEKSAIIPAEIIKGLKNLVKEIPELSRAITSVLVASLEVNQITAKKRNMGNNKFPKYQVKSM